VSGVVLVALVLVDVGGRGAELLGGRGRGKT
jgi:hypothetical protein